MEDKTRITPDLLRSMGYDKKYHSLGADTDAGEQVLKAMEQISQGRTEFICRFFSDERLLDMLLSGTDRVTSIISADPALDKHKPMWEKQIEIMRQRGLKASDVIWGLHIDRDDLAQTINERLEDSQSVAVYDPDQLEKLDTSFYSFKGGAQNALLGVFGHKELFKA